MQTNCLIFFIVASIYFQLTRREIFWTNSANHASQFWLQKWVRFVNTLWVHSNGFCWHNFLLRTGRFSPSWHELRSVSGREIQNNNLNIWMSLEQRDHFKRLKAKPEWSSQILPNPLISSFFKAQSNCSGNSKLIVNN